MRVGATMAFLFIPVHGTTFLSAPLCVLSFYGVLAILVHYVRWGRTMTVKARMRQFALQEQARRSSVDGTEEHLPLYP